MPPGKGMGRGARKMSAAPKVKPKSKTTRGPQGLPVQSSSPQKPATPPSRKRPAPRVQPGPISDAERKTIARAKAKPAYKQKVAKTRVERKSREAAKRADATRTGMSDADRKRVSRFYETEQFEKALETAADANRPRQSTLSKIVEGGKDTQSDRVNRALKQAKRSPSMRKYYGGDVLSVAVRGARKAEDAEAKQDAAVGKILNETMRPVRAQAGAARAVIRGENVPKAVKKGAIDNKGPTFGDVYREDAGLPKGVAAVLGFTTDVVADPTTYFSFGTSTVAKQAAVKAGQRAMKQGMGAEAAKRAAREAARKADRVARKAGASDEAARGAAEAAARDAAERTQRQVIDRVERAAAKRASQQKGVSVRFAGKTVPGVTKATARATQKTKAVASKAATKPVVRSVAPKVKAAGSGTKDVAREVRPQLRPVGVSEAEHVTARQAARRARAATTQGVAQAEREARDLAARIGRENYERVIDAIERGTIGKLDDAKLRQAAVDIRSKMRYAQRVRKRSGLGEGSVKNYFPHALEEPLLKGLGVVKDDTAKPMGAGGRVIPKPGSSRKRELRGPISEVNPKLADEGKGKFSTDAPLVYTNYMDETAKVAAKATLLKDLAASGKPAKPGTRLRDGDAVYHLNTKDGRLRLEEVKPSEVGKVKAGQYVVLNKKVVDRTLESAAPKQSTSKIGRGYDSATRKFKLLATATPGFHARNAIGDTQMAYLAQPARKLPKNLKASGGAIRIASRQEAHPFQRELSGETITVAGKSIPTEKFVEMARREGVIRSGVVGREFEDLAADTVKNAKKTGNKRRPLKRVQRWMANREDWPRLATFKQALDDGMSPGNAADRAMNFHIDYGDLTEFERKVGRRAAPFYTFSARAIPMHAKALVQTPGKFANIEKARQETAKGFGFDEDWQSGLQEFQQRQAPFVIKTGGKAQAISAALPITVLNELPTSFSPTSYLSELGKFGVQMANPLGKWPIELLAGRNMFLRKDIEPDEAPLVSAPSWVRLLPADAKKAWGVTEEYVDPRTGKKALGWRGTPDYIARALPGAVGFVNTMLTEGSNRRGMNPEQRAGSFVAGVRSEPYDPVTAAMSALFERRNELQKQISALRQQKKTAEHRPMREAQARLKLLEYQIKTLSVRRKDKLPFFENRKKPSQDAERIMELEAKRERLSKPLRDRAKRGETVFESDELKRVKDELRRLKGPQPKQARVRTRPLSPEEQVRKEIEDFKKQQRPGAVEDEIRREIEQFRAEQQALAGVK